uniref:Uncharacterized protein n=1 Tax=Tanacetum cinerariifolium TaxID=118510 RepID=A0A6L2L6R4_TANCI|nr:hypothetical protein [Tanacetum cinerariifolium]
MSEPLSSDRVFDFLVDELEPHPAYDFFASGPLPGYAGNPNNKNEWIEANVPLFGELGVVADEPMVGPIVDEIDEPIVEAEEQEVNENDFENDDSEGFDEGFVTPPLMPVVPPPSIYEVGGPSTTVAEGQPFPLPAPRLPIPPSVIEDLSTRLGNLQYGHGQLVNKVIQVMASQMVHAVDRFEQIGTQVEQGQQIAA